MKNPKSIFKKTALIITLYSFSTIALSQVFEDDRERLSDIINTKFTDTKPLISYDNRTLYLTRQNHPLNTDGERDIQDIFISKKDIEGNWQPAENIGRPLNNEHPNGVSSISIGGDTALVINIFGEYGYEKGASLSIKSNEIWSTPEPINIEDFKNKSDFVDYFISSDGEHMFLAIESKNTYGDQDIYISNRIDAFNWTKPINLGPNVNTRMGEFSPFLTSDRKYLFFASYGHDGFGDSDIFYCERLDDSWTNWSEARNLGEKINSSGFEAYFTIPARGLYAYFVSDFESNAGSRDIFRAKIPIPLNPTPGVVLSGVTKDKTSMSPVKAIVTIDPLAPYYPSNILETNSGNNFNYQRSILEFPITFNVRADAENYMSASQYFSIEHKDKREVKKDLYLVPIEIDNQLISHDVSFTPNTSQLDKRGEAEVNRIASYMIAYPTIKMKIGSHVAHSDNSSADLILSEERLEKVYQVFLSKGIESDRLFTTAFGSSEPFVNENNIEIFDKTKPNERFTFTIVADQDNDGVSDPDDRCVTEAGSKENFGCPELKEEVVKVFEQALTGIQFETSKDIIKPVSFPILENVIEIMKENSTFFLKIKGHTDSQGEEDDNQILSDKRAASTMKYLVKNGIESERLIAFGYGELEPVASNETREGRAKNRRVVFDVVYSKEDMIK